MLPSRSKNTLPVEALWEFKVQEITPDGQEILEKPLTQAENFQRIVNGIDFSSKTSEEFDSSDASKQQPKSNVPEKTWLLMRDQIRNSLTEVCAFIDLMAVIQETKCIVISPTTPHDQDMENSSRSPRSQTITCLAGKKMALSVASDALLKGAERFRLRFIELSRTSHRGENANNPLSYHERLIELRKSWRIKLVQNTVLGDVSLRCLGSRAKEGGNFEVYESSDPGSDKNIAKVKFSSAMESLLTRDRCTGRLCVRLRKVEQNSTTDWNDFLKRSLDGPPKADISHYTSDSTLSTFDKLCLAQNLLICREILSTLSYEVSLIGPGNIGNNVVAFSSHGEVLITVFPGVQLSVSLEKFDDSVDNQDECHPGLSTQLKRLLFRQHTCAWTDIASIPNPPTGPVQVPQRLRAAGALITSAETLLGNTYSGVESMPIVVASVAGFGGPAASAWMAAAQNHASGGPMLASAPVGQERYSYFTDWGTSQLQQQRSMAMGDVMLSSMALSGLEHGLRSFHASPAAISCVLGSGGSLLGQLVILARHRYLRDKLQQCLTEYARADAAPGMCVEMLWHGVASPFESSVNVTLHSVGYSSFRSRITIRVCGGGGGDGDGGRRRACEIVVYGFNSTGLSIPATGTDDMSTSIKRIIKALEVRNQMSTLQGLASTFLGWTQLGCTADASVGMPGTPPASPSTSSGQTGEDAPPGVTAIIMASPSGRRLVCIRSISGSSQDDRCGGISLLVSKIHHHDDLSRLATDSATLQSALAAAGEASAESRSTDTINFRKVDLSRIPAGRHIIAKIEAVLTCLSSV